MLESPLEETKKISFQGSILQGICFTKLQLWKKLPSECTMRMRIICHGEHGGVVKVPAGGAKERNSAEHPP